MPKTIRPLAQTELLPKLRRAFWLAAVALTAVGLTFALLAWANSRSVYWVLQSEEVGRLARETRNLAVDRNSSIRGYLLTRQQVSLGVEFAARVPLAEKLDSLVLISEGNVSQQDRARAIRSAVQRWERGWVMPSLAARSAAAGAAQAGENLAGKELFDSIRAAFDSFMAGERRIFERRVAVLSFLQKFSLVAVVAEVLLLIGVLGWIARRSFAQTREIIEQHDQLEAQTMDLQQQAAELEEQAVELEEQTDEAIRTASELAAANDGLAKTVERLEAAESVATAARSESEDVHQLLDFVLNSSPVGVALYDRNLRFVRVNTAMAAMTGFAANQHTGKSMEDVAHHDLAESMEPLLQQVIEAGEPVLNVPVSGPDPAYRMKDRNFLVSFFPVRLPGRQSGVGAVMLETTQYRQLEEQLLQAQKMEAVGRLAGGVAHDFNNMLTAVLSYSELLLAEMPAGSQQRDDMLEIMKAAQKATALTRQLLAFSRQQVLRPTLVNVNETVRGLQNMLKRLSTNDIELTCRLTPELWTVAADQTELERVITNLVLNARDAMPEGGKLIIETTNVNVDGDYAGTHADTMPGPYVMVAVTDTGVGMSREVREKLFEPFFTTKEKGKGTGLGLPSVYGIVKQSGGFVWVYSEPGRGTTFKIYLPRADEAPSTAHATPRGSRKVGAETILLVEDDEEVRHVATRILRGNGYRVLEAANGADALRVCESELMPVDLIVTDLVMPEMGGTELAERIREKQPDARIIFTSGYTEDAVVRQSVLNPNEIFIEKPFTPASLMQKTREVLGNGQS